MRACSCPLGRSGAQTGQTSTRQTWEISRRSLAGSRRRHCWVGANVLERAVHPSDPCDPLLVNDQCRVLTARDAYAFSRRRSDPQDHDQRSPALSSLLVPVGFVPSAFAQESTSDCLPHFSLLSCVWLVCSFYSTFMLGSQSQTPTETRSRMRLDRWNRR